MKEIGEIVKYVYECGFEEGEHLAMAQSKEPKRRKALQAVQRGLD